MNSLLEVANTWFGTLVEAFVTLTSEVANVIIWSLSLTPNTSLSSSTPPLDTSTGADAVVESREPTVSSTASPITSESVLTDYPQFIQDIAVYFVFDDFQYLLFKIFIGILVGNICLICLVWQIYGERISEFFMSDTPNIPPEELQRRIIELDLPRVHSQRY